MLIEARGKVTKALRGIFEVELENGLKPLVPLVRLSGKMRKNNIKVFPGDKVTVELSSYVNSGSGRISGRIIRKE